MQLERRLNYGPYEMAASIELVRRTLGFEAEPLFSIVGEFIDESATT